MPRYDYRCESGHEEERIADRDASLLSCSDCGRPSRRFIAPAHAPRANGFTPKPTREHYVNVDRAINAQHELIDQCRREGVEAPDCYGIAKERIRRGDAVAIE